MWRWQFRRVALTEVILMRMFEGRLSCVAILAFLWEIATWIGVVTIVAVWKFRIGSAQSVLSDWESFGALLPVLLALVVHFETLHSEVSLSTGVESLLLFSFRSVHVRAASQLCWCPGLDFRLKIRNTKKERVNTHEVRHSGKFENERESRVFLWQCCTLYLVESTNSRSRQLCLYTRVISKVSGRDNFFWQESPCLCSSLKSMTET